MISALSGSIALVGGGSVCIENGLLGIPSIKRRTQAVYLGEAGEGFGGDLAGVLAELFGKAFCVVAADLEGDDGADVAEDGVGGRLVQLSQILVRHDQRQAILAGFTEDGCENSGGEVLEFIDVERKITAFDFGDVRAGHRCLLNAVDQQGSEQH